jgi:hypothetical protein
LRRGSEIKKWFIADLFTTPFLRVLAAQIGLLEQLSDLDLRMPNGHVVETRILIERIGF